MTRMVWVAVVALVAVGAVGCATAAEPLEPLIVGSERFFTLEWAGGERRGRPVVYGSITNEWGFAARRVQLLVESLDAAEREERRTRAAEVAGAAQEMLKQRPRRRAAAAQE